MDPPYLVQHQLGHQTSQGPQLAWGTVEVFNCDIDVQAFFNKEKVLGTLVSSPWHSASSRSSLCSNVEENSVQAATNTDTATLQVHCH